MVSGFVTSPCDQLRIFSGLARLMRIESKSVMLLPRSNGHVRYKVSSDAPLGLRLYVAATAPVPEVLSTRYSVLRTRDSLSRSGSSERYDFKPSKLFGRDVASYVSTAPIPSPRPRSPAAFS